MAPTLAEGDIRVDAGISGKRADNRPGLIAALDSACQARGVLVVYSLSRLARSVRDTLDIAERLERAGADLVSLSEQIDTTSAGREDGLPDARGPGRVRTGPCQRTDPDGHGPRDQSAKHRSHYGHDLHRTAERSHTQQAGTPRSPQDPGLADGRTVPALDRRRADPPRHPAQEHQEPLDPTPRSPTSSTARCTMTRTKPIERAPEGGPAQPEQSAA